MKGFKERLRNLRVFLHEMQTVLVENGHAQRRSQAANPLAGFGRKVFSQSDEDGITLEIVSRLKLTKASYCEFGVGDGLECNTLVLSMLGWKGFWISGQPLSIDLSGLDPSFFNFAQDWITNDNVVALYRRSCDRIGVTNVDVVSFDLDSNDLYYVHSLLASGVSPSMFVVEYNAKFVPPIRWSTRKEENLIWNGTDYMGASLQSFVDVFDQHGYSLICCNAASGANAFFIRSTSRHLFPEVPEAIGDLYAAPNYVLPRRSGHPQSPKTVERALELGQRLHEGDARPEFSD